MARVLCEDPSRLPVRYHWLSKCYAAPAVVLWLALASAPASSLSAHDVDTDPPPIAKPTVARDASAFCLPTDILARELDKRSVAHTAQSTESPLTLLVGAHELKLHYRMCTGNAAFAYLQTPRLGGMGHPSLAEASPRDEDGPQDRAMKSVGYLLLLTFWASRRRRVCRL